MAIPHVLNEGKTAYHMALHGLLGLFGETAQGSTKLKKCALFEHQCIQHESTNRGHCFHVYNLRRDNHLTWTSEPGAKVKPLAVQREYLHLSVILRPRVMALLWESNPRPPALLQSSPLLTELILLRHTTIVQTHKAYVPNCNNTSSFSNATYLQ